MTHQFASLRLGWRLWIRSAPGMYSVVRWLHALPAMWRSQVGSRSQSKLRRWLSLDEAPRPRFRPRRKLCPFFTATGYSDDYANTPFRYPSHCKSRYLGRDAIASLRPRHRGEPVESVGVPAVLGL